MNDTQKKVTQVFDLMSLTVPAAVLQIRVREKRGVTMVVHKSLSQYDKVSTLV